MNFIRDLILKYTQFRKRKNIIAIEKKERAEAKWKAYCLKQYGVYHNAYELTREQMLKVFWKILLQCDNYYDVSKFNANTNINEPAKQTWVWNELGSAEFTEEIERVFGFLENDITQEEYDKVNTFGEAADLLIKKAKEKKLKQQEQHIK
jgi:hypothetical protein